MEVYNGMSGKKLRDWRKANRLRAIEEMKQLRLRVDELSQKVEELEEENRQLRKNAE